MCDITGDCHRQLYARWTGAVGVLEASRLGRVLFPSLYFVGTK